MTIMHVVSRLFALMSLGIFVTGAWLFGWWVWWRATHAAEEFIPEPNSAVLYWGAGLLLFSLFGRFGLPFLLARPGGSRAARLERKGEVHTVQGDDGAILHAEIYGKAGRPVLVLTHGWGMDSTLWWDARSELQSQFRIVVWDLPGLGKSKLAPDGRVTIERFASNLASVVALAEGAPVVLIGHSIGGMITQTYCAKYPDAVRDNVAGIVLENTTHTNPLETTFMSGVFRTLQHPIIEPAMWLDIVLAPFFWLMNWSSYLNGSAHVSLRLTGFGSMPTRAQIDHAALLQTRNSPAVQAKGNLAMMNWSVTSRLASINVPALIIVGDRDLVTLPSAGREIADRIPGARLLANDAAGHMGPVEEAAFYNRSVAEFAEAVLRGDAPAVPRKVRISR